jgi:hypothetical protein
MWTISACSSCFLNSLIISLSLNALFFNTSAFLAFFFNSLFSFFNFLIFLWLLVDFCLWEVSRPSSFWPTNGCSFVPSNCFVCPRGLLVSKLGSSYALSSGKDISISGKYSTSFEDGGVLGIFLDYLCLCQVRFPSFPRPRLFIPHSSS